MLVTTRLLLAVLAAAQLPAHISAVPLPGTGALDAVDVTCPGKYPYVRMVFTKTDIF